MSTVYFQDLGMTKVRNFLPASIICLCKSPLTLSESVKFMVSMPCHSVIFWKCTCRMGQSSAFVGKASRHSAVSGFGVVVGS